jgi:hypothetical protein
MCSFLSTLRCQGFILNYLGYFISCMGSLVCWLPMLFHKHLGVFLKLSKLFHRHFGVFPKLPMLFHRHFGHFPKLLKLFTCCLRFFLVVKGFLQGVWAFS